jgi:hypothetical protein
MTYSLGSAVVRECIPLPTPHFAAPTRMHESRRDMYSRNRSRHLALDRRGLLCCVCSIFDERANGLWIRPSIRSMAIIFALVELGKKLGLPRKARRRCRSPASRRFSAWNPGAKRGQSGLRHRSSGRPMYSSAASSRYARTCSPTSMNAEVLQQRDLLGCVKAGAHADLLVVDGDPLEDIELLKILLD